MFDKYIQSSTDISEASRVWAGIAPIDLNIDFNNIEKLKLEELIDTNIVILSVKEAQGQTGTYFTCLCVSEKHKEEVFIMSTGASAVSRKLKVASQKGRLPLKGKIVVKTGKKDQEYFDIISCDTVTKKAPDTKNSPTKNSPAKKADKNT
jgi:hypothetical protein